MKRSVIFSVVMVTMMMVCGNSYGQGRGQQMSSQRGGQQREMVMNSNGGMQMRGSQQMNMSRGNQQMDMNRGGQQVCGRGMGNTSRGGREMSMSRGGCDRMVGTVGCPRVDDRGFLPGWEGRVRYMDGRWGYLRGSEWYWYDTYYEPGYYFGQPLCVFRTHLSPIGRGIVGGVVGGIILGSILSSL